MVSIPVPGNRESGEMETAIPVFGNRCSGEMETGNWRSYNVVMRFAQIHYGRSVYDPV